MGVNGFHIRFIKLQYESKVAMYRVESSDFVQNACWEEIGQLQIHLEDRDYIFNPGERWRLEKIIPPKFHALSEAERVKEYRDVWAPLKVGHGNYARRVHQFARFCIEFYNLPDAYPDANFI